MSDSHLIRTRLKGLKDSPFWGEHVRGYLNSKNKGFTATWVKKIMGSGLLCPEGLIGEKLPGKGNKHRIYIPEHPFETILTIIFDLIHAQRDDPEHHKVGLENQFNRVEKELMQLWDRVRKLGGPAPHGAIKALAKWRTKALTSTPPRPLKSRQAEAASRFIRHFRLRFSQVPNTCVAMWTVKLLKLIGMDLKVETVRKWAAKIPPSQSR